MKSADLVDIFDNKVNAMISVTDRFIKQLEEQVRVANETCQGCNELRETVDSLTKVIDNQIKQAETLNSNYNDLNIELSKVWCRTYDLLVKDCNE